MNKRIFLAGLTLMLVLFFVGCSGGANDTDNPVESLPDSMATNPEYTVTEETTIWTTVEETTEPIPEYLYAYLTSAEDFSEGVAWVRFYDPTSDGEEKVGLLHSDDLLIYTSDEIQVAGYGGSEFSGGYGYVNDADCFYIFDAYGNLTAQSPEDDSSYKIMVGGDGVYFVRQQIRTMDVNEDRYGFITGEGEWLVELTPECPLLTGTIDNEVQFHYFGEHIFSAYRDVWSSTSASRFSFYNADTGVRSQYIGCIRYEDDNGNLLTAYNGLIPFQFYDNYCTDWCFYVYNIEKNDFVGYGLENYEKIYYHDGIVVEVEDRNWPQPEEMNIYTIDGGDDGGCDLLLEYSKYTLYMSGTKGFYEFHDGSAAVIVIGADNCRYLGFIDLTGEFLFEPVKLIDYNGYVHFSACKDNMVYASIYDYEGNPLHAIICSDGSLIDAKELFDDENGMYEKPYYDWVSFSEGFAWSRNVDLLIHVSDGVWQYSLAYIKNPLANP